MRVPNHWAALRLRSGVVNWPVCPTLGLTHACSLPWGWLWANAAQGLASFVWSASANANNDNNAWGVNFNNGNDNVNHRNNNNRVRLVRESRQ